MYVERIRTPRVERDPAWNSAENGAQEPFDWLPEAGHIRRIAVISVHGCPLARLGEKDTGGMSVYVRQLGLYLGRSGLKVDIYSRSHDPQEGQIISLGENSQVMRIPSGKTSGTQ